MLIDAHTHFWSLDRGDYRWLKPELGSIYRDCSPGELAPWLKWAGIERTILVQAADTVAETNYLLVLARAAPFVAGVVGWVDLESRAAPAQIERLAADPFVVGIRPMLQDLPDVAWMLKPALGPALKALAASGLAFDALVRMDHVPHLRTFLRRYPELRVVIDHAAKPSIACGMKPWLSFGAWRDHMAGIASESTAFCKLSGLVTEATGEWSTPELRPYFDALYSTFGPRRLMWGSDWPIVELGGGFEAWWRSTVELVNGLPPEEIAGILGDNAASFYRLRARSVA